MKKLSLVFTILVSLLLGNSVLSSAQRAANPLNIAIDDTAGNSILSDGLGPANYLPNFYVNGLQGVSANLDKSGNMSFHTENTLQRAITLDLTNQVASAGCTPSAIPFDPSKWPFAGGAESGLVHASITSQVQPMTRGSNGLVDLQVGSDSNCGIGIGFADPQGLARTWSLIFNPNQYPCTTWAAARRLTSDPAGSWQLQGTSSTIGLLYYTPSGKNASPVFVGYFSIPFLLTLDRQ